MVNSHIDSIWDLMQVSYGKRGVDIDITKSDDPILSTTTGVYNAIYGPKVFMQIMLEDKLTGLLPKTVYKQSGWRVITAAPTASARVDENGALPETDKFDYHELSVKPAHHVTFWEDSHIQELLARGDDDTIGAIADLQADYAMQHRDLMQQYLLADANTVITTGLDSIDRIVNSLSEELGCLDAGDADIWGIDRSDASYSWADAQIDHNSGSDRNLTITLIKKLIVSTIDAGANPEGQVWVTGNDTVNAIESLFQDQQRYMGTANVTATVNGITTKKGEEAGFTVSTLFKRPLIGLKSNHVTDNGNSDSISKLYLLDISDPKGSGMPRLSLDIAEPTQYFEAGMKNGTVIEIDKIANQAALITSGQIRCRMIACQGKLRDLQF